MNRVTAELVDCCARLAKVSLWLRLVLASVDSLLVKSCPSVGVNGYCEVGTLANSACGKLVVCVPLSPNPRVCGAP